jgi:hypothetical protein
MNMTGQRASETRSLRHAIEAQEVQHGRHDADADDEQDADDDGAEREEQRRPVELQVGPVLRFVIGDVHCFEEREDAVVGAVEREEQADDESDAQCVCVGRGEALELALYELQAAGR